MPTAVLPADPVPLGLRERKKLATRDALVGAALDLFERQGLERTTVDEIAAAVDVSPRTFHRYFPAKEDVLFADAAERREHFVALLASRADDEPLLDSLRYAAAVMAGGFVAGADSERRRLRLVRTSTGLAARNLHQSDQWAQSVAAHAARRLGLDERDPLPVLLGTCTVAALRTAVDRWLEHPDADYQRELDRCFELLADLRAATAPRRARSRR